MQYVIRRLSGVFIRCVYVILHVYVSCVIHNVCMYVVTEKDTYKKHHTHKPHITDRGQNN